ncbi:MAG: DNA primase [Chlamydiae bacterium]|nr:DNA primase [Chlamydiota bacterium]
MPLYTKESLDHLRQKVDLLELLSSHLQLKRYGGVYKTLCPFHEEKTPSFIIKPGDHHYHCFGCGAHGDAIAFLMIYLKMGFIDAVEYLAERFQIILEKEKEDKKQQKVQKTVLKEAVEKACQIYQYALLHTEEGHRALTYLYQRGIDIEFIKKFRIGYAPFEGTIITKTLQELGHDLADLYLAGLTHEGRGKDFFEGRITFPISDPFGSVIGFSARKIDENTFGGKYINSPETPLFRKSYTLFGLDHSRMRIAKERKAIVVEGQIDALRLIHGGFDYTVAALGTAFGISHVEELDKLGIVTVYLAFDGDEAGRQAAIKVGNLFQKKGIEVKVVSFFDGLDPDIIILDFGPKEFEMKLKNAIDFLTFIVQFYSQKFDLSSPAQKNQFIQTITEMIKGWDEPVMIFESLKKLAILTSIPESALPFNEIPTSKSYFKQIKSLEKIDFDPDLVLETDLLRWLILRGKEKPKIVDLAKLNISQDHFRHRQCSHFYHHYLSLWEKGENCDMIALASALEKEEDAIFFSQIVHKKINLNKAEEGVVEVIERMLLRKWMEERERIKCTIQSGKCGEEELLILAKTFDEIKKQPPKIKLL